MSAQTAVVLGATGMIGSQVLELLLKDDTFSKVRVLVRRPLNIQHPKLETEVCNFSNFEEFKAKLGSGDCTFCCIGTTNAKVKGDKQLYRTIDFDIPVNAARFGKEAGFQQFLLVSALGADSSSRIFYSRLKGEVEEVIATFQYKSFHVFRPGLLLGNRNEDRPGERFMQLIAKPLSFLFPSNSKPIEGATVAQAMVNAAKTNAVGLHYYKFQEMNQLTAVS